MQRITNWHVQCCSFQFRPWGWWNVPLLTANYSPREWTHLTEVDWLRVVVSWCPASDSDSEISSSINHKVWGEITYPYPNVSNGKRGRGYTMTHGLAPYYHNRIEHDIFAFSVALSQCVFQYKLVKIYIQLWWWTPNSCVFLCYNHSIIYDNKIFKKVLTTCENRDVTHLEIKFEHMDERGDINFNKIHTFDQNRKSTMDK